MLEISFCYRSRNHFYRPKFASNYTNLGSQLYEILANKNKLCPDQLKVAFPSRSRADRNALVRWTPPCPRSCPRRRQGFSQRERLRLRLCLHVQSRVVLTLPTCACCAGYGISICVCTSTTMMLCLTSKT